MFLKPVFGAQARRTMLEGFSDILFDLQIPAPDASFNRSYERNLDGFGN